MKTETIQEMAAIQSGAIVSNVLTQNGSVTLFAMAQGESISAYTSACAAQAVVLTGTIIFTVDKEQKELQPMECIHLTANLPHALYAEKDSRMLLIQKGEQ